MNNSQKQPQSPEHDRFQSQTNDVTGLSAELRDALIISLRRVDNTWIVLSRYGEDVWWLTGATTNVVKADSKLDFATVPEAFRNQIKAVMYRWLRRGRDNGRRAGAATLRRMLDSMLPFLKYLLKLGITSLSDASPVACTNYAQVCKSGNGGRKLADETISKRITAVEALYELSQYTHTPMREYPWLDTSPTPWAAGNRSLSRDSNKTPLIPDDVFSVLFQKAWAIVTKASEILDLRDEMTRVAAKSAGLSSATSKQRRNERLAELGFDGGLPQLKIALLDIRTASYIVVASLSGCRNHELAYVRKNAFYSTEDDDGEEYWWMRAKSTKTGEGDTEWMIPEAAVTALKVMERWAEPYQAALEQEIKSLRERNVLDSQIAEATDHLGALFVGKDNAKANLVRTLSLKQTNDQLRAFVRRNGITWKLASHQFRRKFANYAARSQFGDLRYLKQHFKHWSMNMTLGYALNESQEMALYEEIENELDALKEDVVASWLDPSVPLAGGYGQHLQDWRGRDESIVLFKDRAHMIKSIAGSTAIRSNGHAWCTADDNLCVGNTLERTRCGGGCGNAVIGPQHAFIYQGLYDHLATLEGTPDIGKGGRARVQRDLDRCASVLQSLGFNPERPQSEQ